MLLSWRRGRETGASRWIQFIVTILCAIFVGISQVYILYRDWNDEIHISIKLVKVLNMVIVEFGALMAFTVSMVAP